MKKFITLVIAAAILSGCNFAGNVGKPDPRIAQCAAQGKVLKRDNSGITRCNVDFDASEALRPNDIQAQRYVSQRRAAN